MNLQELVINGIPVIGQKDYATATGVTESAVGQRKDLPFIDFEGVRGKFIDLNRLALIEKETANKLSEITIPKADLFRFSHQEMGAFFSQYIAESEKYRQETHTVLDHLRKEVATLQAVSEKSQKDLGNALDRENALRDEKELLLKEVQKVSETNAEQAEFIETLQTAVEEKSVQINDLTADLGKAHKDLAEMQTVLTDTKHDNDLKVLEIKTLKNEVIRLEDENGDLKQEVEDMKNFTDGLRAEITEITAKTESVKTDLLNARNAEKIAVLEKEKLAEKFAFLEEKLETQKANYTIFTKILEGNSRFAEPFEVWFEKNPQNPNNMRPLVKTSLGYFLGTGVSLTPENELVSLADYPSILANTLKSSKGGAK